MENNEIIKKQIEELTNKVLYYNSKYHTEDISEITDFEYDALKNELKSLEEKYPEFALDNSPTKTVGGEIKKGFEQVEHEVPLLSLQDVFDYEEIYSFDKRVRESGKTNYVVETKIDGLTCSLKYKKGLLVEAATRGNGFVGENVTENVKTIKNVPQKLSKEVDIIVRGEVFISKSDFQKVNEEREYLKLPLFANPRNLAAGSLRQLDKKIAAERPLDIYIFNVQKLDGYKFRTHLEELKFLEELGFNVIPFRKKCTNVEEIIEKIEEIGNHRDDLIFGIDGAVIKVNDLELRKKMGTTFKNPRWAIAYKYPPEKAETIVEDIVVEVGRTGVLTPVAILTPVVVAGSRVSKTTLHNEDFIKSKDLKIGDSVIVQKQGDIIPEIIEVNFSKRTGNEKVFEMPKTCPICGAEAIREENESAYRCMGIECPAKLIKNMAHFVSKEAMDIDGLGIKVIIQLSEEGLINNIADIYSLKTEDIKVLKGKGEKSAKNLINAINDSKDRDLSALITGFGIRYIGKKIAKTIAQIYGSIDNIENATIEELAENDTIGPKKAEEIYKFFKSEQTIDLIKRLKEAGVNTILKKSELKDDRFDCKSFVLTGSLDKYSRDEVTKIIEQFGGKVKSSISKETNYLLVGDKAGSKLNKAMELGIEIIDEPKFDELIKL